MFSSSLVAAAFLTFRAAAAAGLGGSIVIVNTITQGILWASCVVTVCGTVFTWQRTSDALTFPWERRAINKRVLSVRDKGKRLRPLRQQESSDFRH